MMHSSFCTDARELKGSGTELNEGGKKCGQATMLSLQCFLHTSLPNPSTATTTCSFLKEEEEKGCLGKGTKEASDSVLLKRRSLILSADLCVPKSSRAGLRKGACAAFTCHSQGGNAERRPSRRGKSVDPVTKNSGKQTSSLAQ